MTARRHQATRQGLSKPGITESGQFRSNKRSNFGGRPSYRCRGGHRNNSRNEKTNDFNLSHGTIPRKFEMDLVFYEAGQLKNGANNWTRTSDPRFTKALLYQLSYVGNHLLPGQTPEYQPLL